MADREDWLALVDKLRCSLCNNYLSYCPVFLNEFGNICGRCCNDGPTRNFAYEKLAYEFMFPCRYRSNGCDEELTMPRIIDHEPICPVRTVCCTLPACIWEGPMNSLIEHCRQDHAELIIERDREFDINLGSSYEAYMFYIADNRLLRVSWQFDFDKKKLEFLVEEHYEELARKKYTCILNLRFGSQTTRTEFDNDATTKILYYDMLKEHLDATLIHGQLRPRPNDDNLLAKSNVNNHLLASLKCSNCSLYALPPILETVKGLVICRECQEKTCLKIKPNQVLTGVANVMIYPCMNLKGGCNFFSGPSQMQAHYKSCLFKDIVCELDNSGTACTWKGPRKDLVPHIKLEHVLQECGETIRLDVGTHHQKILAKFGYFYFQFTLVSGSNRLSFFVSKVNGFLEKFRYKIVIHDYKNPKHRFILEANCLSLEEAKLAPSILYREQISTFLEDRKKKKYMHFKIFIVKDASQ